MTFDVKNCSVLFVAIVFSFLIIGCSDNNDLSSEDTWICDQIPDATIKADCYESKIMENFAFCLIESEDIQKPCFESEFKQRKTSICTYKERGYFIFRNTTACFSTFSVELSKPSICSDELSGEQERDCITNYFESVVPTTDECRKLKDEDAIKHCNLMVIYAERKNNQ